MQDTDLMLHTLLELGESMLADGADVRRVEQTLSRISQSFSPMPAVKTMASRPPIAAVYAPMNLRIW